MIKKLIIYIFFFNILSVSICLIISVATKQYQYIYSALLFIPFVFLHALVHYSIIEKSIEINKHNQNKVKIVMFYTFGSLYSFVLFIPIIISFFVSQYFIYECILVISIFYVLLRPIVLIIEKKITNKNKEKTTSKDAK